MSLFPRLRMLFARRSWLYWLLVGACAIAVWLGVADAHAQLQAARNSWGQTRHVFVATGPIRAGEPVRAVAHDYPGAMVPMSAVSSLPSDAVAARSIADGEVVVAEDLTDEGVVPLGWVVFAVPAHGAPTLQPGDEVSVFGSGQQWCDGIVAAIDETSVEAAVPQDCAASVSAQLALSAVTLGRLP